MSATRYGWIKPKRPPEIPSMICVDNKKKWPALIESKKIINAQRIGKHAIAAINSGFRPIPRSVHLPPTIVATDIINCAVTIAIAVKGMAVLDISGDAWAVVVVGDTTFDVVVDVNVVISSSNVVAAEVSVLLVLAVPMSSPKTSNTFALAKLCA